MKWGVRKATNNLLTNAYRASRAIGAAYIEGQASSVRRSMARNKTLNKNNKSLRQHNNARYKAKLKKLNKTYNSKISDLSEVDIERGRSAYKTIKSVGVSVAVAAASTAVGNIYAPAAVAAKLAGAGLTTVLNSVDARDNCAKQCRR